MATTKRTRTARNQSGANGAANRIEEFREQAGVVGQGLSGMASTAGAAATDQLDPVRDYVKEAPLKSLLMAAGIGAVFAMIMRR